MLTVRRAPTSQEVFHKFKKAQFIVNKDKCLLLAFLDFPAPPPNKYLGDNRVGRKDIALAGADTHIPLSVSPQHTKT